MILSGNLTNLVQQIELQLVSKSICIAHKSLPCYLRTDRGRFFQLNTAIDRRLKESRWSFWLERVY